VNEIDYYEETENFKHDY